MAGGIEVADVFRRHGPAFRAARSEHLDRDQRRVMGAIEACRTAALGGHVRRCADCGHTASPITPAATVTVPNASVGLRKPGSPHGGRSCCRFRVSTWSSPCRRRSGQTHSRTRRRSAILFRAAAETLRTIAADPRHLGAEIGGVAVLHPGVRRCSTIRMSTASCRAAASRPTAGAGSPAHPGSVTSAFSPTAIAQLDSPCVDSCEVAEELRPGCLAFSAHIPDG